MDEDIEQEKCCNHCNCNTDQQTDQTADPACLDYKKTVIAQYANSTVMLSLLDGIDKRIKVCGFFDDFYRIVWNINTAEGFGLDIWGRIVGVTRTVRSFMGFFWGFNEETLLIARPYYDDAGYDGYDENLPADQQSEAYYTAVGMFRDLQGQDGDGIDLMEEVKFDDDDFRKLILAKAYANISDYSISSINFLLMSLFVDKTCCCSDCKDSTRKIIRKCRGICCKKNQRFIYVQDNLDMTLSIVLNWLPSKRDVALIYNTGLLSRPAGVEMKINVQVEEKS